MSDDTEKYARVKEFRGPVSVDGNGKSFRLALVHCQPDGSVDAVWTPAQDGVGGDVRIFSGSGLGEGIIWPKEKVDPHRILLTEEPEVDEAVTKDPRYDITIEIIQPNGMPIKIFFDAQDDDRGKEKTE